MPFSPKAHALQRGQAPLPSMKKKEPFSELNAAAPVAAGRPATSSSGATTALLTQGASLDAAPVNDDDILDF
jgi:hypothetical protein